MRVLQVVESFAAGTGEVVLALSERLARDGHEVVIAHGTRGEPPPRVQSLPGLTLHPLPWGDRSARAQLAAARRLRRLVGELEPDLAHLHSSFAGAVGLAVLGRRLPTIYTPHAYSFIRINEPAAKLWAYRTIERLLARRASLIGAVSRSEGRLARSVVGAPRVVVVENGIPELDPGAVPAPQQRADVEVVAMGRIGHQHLPAATGRILRAVSELATVTWIGAAPARDPGLADLEASGVPVTGWLAREAALARLGGATALLHWTAWDALPLTVLEAFARDVVVIGSDIASNRDLLDREQIADTEQDAAGLLREVILDDGLRERLLTAQRARRGHFSADRMARDWSAVYAALVAGIPPPAEYSS